MALFKLHFPSRCIVLAEGRCREKKIEMKRSVQYLTVAQLQISSSIQGRGTPMAPSSSHEQTHKRSMVNGYPYLYAP